MVVVIVVVIVSLLPSPFIADPSSAAAKGGNVQNRYDGGGRYVPFSYLLQNVHYLPQHSWDGCCLHGQP